MNYIRKKQKTVSYVLIITILAVVFMLNLNITEIASAESTTAVEESSYGVAVVSNENAPFISDIARQEPTRWVTYDPRLGWTTNSNFSNLNYTDKEVTYYTGNGNIQFFAGYINEENYALMATDTLDTIRLEPVQGVTAPSTINANGNVTVNFTYLHDPRGTCVYYNDTKKLKNLCDDFRIPNCNTKVGKGKILYRSTTTNTFGNWSYTDLSNNVTLSFSERHVQIAVIYELNEKGRFLLDPDIHYFVAGVYRFDIY